LVLVFCSQACRFCRLLPRLTLVKLFSKQLIHTTTATPIDAPNDSAANSTSNQNHGSVEQDHSFTYNRDTYTHQQEPSLYAMNDQDHSTLKLYEERLIASKKRVNSGEVAIGKHVETETERVSVPVEKERVVIERVTSADAGKAVAPSSVHFGEGEVARMEIYEETADIHKEAFVREEVRVNKVVEQETVQAQDTIRREELDIDAGGQTIDDKTGRQPKDRS